MKISENFKVREMAGEHVIIMPGRCGADMTRILALNDSSLYLWEALGGKDFTTGDAPPCCWSVTTWTKPPHSAMPRPGCEARRMRRAGVPAARVRRTDGKLEW